MDAFVLSKLGCFGGDSDIEGEDASVFLLNDLVLVLGFVDGFHCLEHILLVNWSNGNTTDWDLGGVQELEQGLKRTEG